MAVVREIVTEEGTRITINDEYCAGKTDEERAADIKRLNQTIYELLCNQQTRTKAIIQPR